MNNGRTLGGLILGLSLLSPASGDAQTIPGHYRMRVCAAAPCTATDSSNIVAAGDLVLFAEGGVLDRIPEGARDRLRRASYMLIYEAPEKTNACFALRRLQTQVGDIEVYAGIIPVGLSMWTLQGGQLRVPVYGSPDARFELVGEVNGATYEGQGWHFDCCRPGLNRRIPFVAERVGEPSIEPCS
jgi:hypothetical protein